MSIIERAYLAATLLQQSILRSASTWAYNHMIPQTIRHVHLMLVYCLADVVDGGPALTSIGSAATTVWL